MRRYIARFCAAAAAVSALAVTGASAQSINTTVEVTRDFGGSLKEIHKAPLPVSELDSTYHTRPDFSYSVFERKYGRQKDFVPHPFAAAPSSPVYDPPVAVLRAAAGFPLATDAMLSLELPLKGAFSLNFYGRHDGYFGKVDHYEYDAAGTQMRSGGRYRVTDMDNCAGLAARYAWGKGEAYAGISYDGVYFADTLFRRSMNALEARAGVHGRSLDRNSFIYGVDLLYGYAADKWNMPSSLNEHYVLADAEIGPAFGGSHSVVLGIEAEYAGYAGYRNLGVVRFDAVPQYRFASGRWNLVAGVRISKVAVSEPDAASGAFVPSGTNASNLLFPLADVRFEAVKKLLTLYFTAGGGNGINRYSDIVRRYGALGAYGEYGAFQNFTVDPFNMSLGLRGSAASRFSYDLSAVYGRRRGVMSFSLMPGERAAADFGTSFGYVAARGALGWSSQDVQAGADVSYTWFHDLSAAADVLSLPALEGNAYVRYNWRKRVFVTADASFMSARSSAHFRVPGWVDLGVEVSYAFRSTASVFLRGGNLLNQRVQELPGQAERGVNFMAGVCLKF